MMTSIKLKLFKLSLFALLTLPSLSQANPNAKARVAAIRSIFDNKLGRDKIEVNDWLRFGEAVVKSQDGPKEARPVLALPLKGWPQDNRFPWFRTYKKGARTTFFLASGYPIDGGEFALRKITFSSQNQLLRWESLGIGLDGELRIYRLEIGKDQKQAKWLTIGRAKRRQWTYVTGDFTNPKALAGQAAKLVAQFVRRAR